MELIIQKGNEVTSELQKTSVLSYRCSLTYIRFTYIRFSLPKNTLETLPEPDTSHQSQNYFMHDIQSGLKELLIV